MGRGGSSPLQRIHGSRSVGRLSSFYGIEVGRYITSTATSTPRSGGWPATTLTWTVSRSRTSGRSPTCLPPSLCTACPRRTSWRGSWRRVGYIAARFMSASVRLPIPCASIVAGPAMVGEHPCGGADQGAEGDSDADPDPAAGENPDDRAGCQAEPGADAGPVPDQRIAVCITPPSRNSLLEDTLARHRGAPRFSLRGSSVGGRRGVRWSAAARRR